MNVHLRKIVEDLSLASEKAGTLAKRLLNASSPLPLSTSTAAASSPLPEVDQDKLIADLNAKVASLTAQLRELTLAMEEIPDALFTDEQLAMFKVAFIKSLSGISTPSLISLYSAEYFQDKPLNIRVAIATCLVNEVTSRNGEPSDLWLTILAKNGAF